MAQPIYSRELVVRQLSISASLLDRYERRGLIRPVRVGDEEGYGPAEIRRLWTILSCHRELGINLAGVEAILQLNDQLDRIYRKLDTLTRELSLAIPDDEPAGDDH